MVPVYEDNHLLIVNKSPGEIVQGDKTGDEPLVESLKRFLKEKYDKPGNVFLGVVHRLDRPVGGLVIFAKTSKALSRMNDMLREGKVHKTYHAIVEGHPAIEEAELRHYITSVEKINKSYVRATPGEGAKEARLRYKVLSKGDNYSLVEIELLTGRKHQIRAQLAASGHPIKGDLKYGAHRSNGDGSISLMAKRLEFVHPVSGKKIELEIPYPSTGLWQALSL